MKAELWFRGVGPNKKAADTPECIGTYEPANDSCDGYVGIGQANPCIVRSLCIRTKKWSEDNQIDPSSLSAVDLFYIRDLVDGYLSKSFADPKTSRAQNRIRKRDELLKMINHFETCLRDRFGLARFQGIPGASNRPVAFRPGKLFFVTQHRSETPQGGTWYCVADKKNIKVARIYLSYGRVEAYMNIALTVTPQNIRRMLDAKIFEFLRVKQFMLDPWQSVCTRLDPRGVGAVASLVKRLADNSEIKLPGLD